MGDVRDDPTLSRLDDQIDWYDRRSTINQRAYKWIKIVQIAATAAIPVLATVDDPDYLIGGLAGAVLVLEGLQQVNQFHHNWITYRSTCEALKHEKYLYLARADYYSDAVDPHALLAERIEGLVSQEHAKWVSARQEADADEGQRP